MNKEKDPIDQLLEATLRRQVREFDVYTKAYLEGTGYKIEDLVLCQSNRPFEDVRRCWLELKTEAEKRPMLVYEEEEE